ncbi:tripartite tricarboxylate transporter TctB family protein [Roseibium aggregatum]|uniref:Tripartite tricarboxylate transporter TctB family protein n=1 Tax=Roseibium aggregatum TaxID=187304 RepID=A0A926P2P2_9HYPH|nr:tripartite tricarboxylate transporter TctB family protein [Roseibium aggregatum]MBD1548450.1 tripartite tricarboxylate transporter TctB family protein [Roseibium aggregatum]
MTGHSRKADMAVSSVLTLIGIAWTVEVFRSIPAGAGGGDVGPRAFPLLYGVLLIMLSAGWGLSRLMASEEPPRSAPPSDVEAEEGTATDTPKARIVALALTLFIVLLYGWMMTRVGFLLATFAVVLFSTLVILRERRFLVIGGMAFGITFATWLVFEVLLGIPLAVGSWINLG